MAKKKVFRKQTYRKPANLKCPFCTQKTEPDYKDYKNLSGFLSDRARILGKDRSGVCSRHQRKLSTSIKRARFLGLLPFTPEI